MAAPDHTVIVIGGGISGLSAAYALTGGDQPRSDAPRVVVLERDELLGGKIRTENFAGRLVDLGPDGFLGRRPEAATLCREIGLADELVPIGSSGAALYARRRLRTMPPGLALGVPTRWWPVARSRILSPGATLRLSRDAWAPRRNSRGPLGDRAIGPLVGRKLGQGVVNTLVDPLVGGIHAGSVADMSCAAVYPLLLAASGRRGSLMRALRSASAVPSDTTPPAPGTDEAVASEPAFWSLRHGLSSLVAGLADVVVQRGATITTGVAVEALERGPSGTGWVVHTSAGPMAASAVVVAVPADVAAELLMPHDAAVANSLRTIDYASVNTVSLTFAEADFGAPLQGTGFLVPRDTRLVPRRAKRRTAAPPEIAMVTAVSYLSEKWPHLAREGEHLLRVSLGHFGDRRPDDLADDELVARACEELSVLLGTSAAPTACKVTRWPASFPQYRVHHLLRVAGIESSLRQLPAIAVAGAAYRGVGMPACIANGRQAAERILEALGGATESSQATS
jgi:oxygen-dependent protoporphyrinogen oxidase